MRCSHHVQIGKEKIIIKKIHLLTLLWDLLLALTLAPPVSPAVLCCAVRVYFQLQCNRL